MSSKGFAALSGIAALLALGAGPAAPVVIAGAIGLAAKAQQEQKDEAKKAEYYRKVTKPTEEYAMRAQLVANQGKIRAELSVEEHRVKIQTENDKRVLERLSRGRVVTPEMLAMPKPVEVLPPVNQSVPVERVLPRISEEDFAGQVPDGAKLIQCSALNNIDRFPVIMVIAGQGAGKSATMGALFSELSGYKVVASPKPLKQCLTDGFDLVFGGDQKTGKWLNFGVFADEVWGDEADLSWHLHQVKREGKQRGSMLRFLWASRRESMNRQLGATEMSQPWRCFYDEASYTYNSGFNNPMDATGKAEKAAQTFVKGVSKDAFQNFRGQMVQFFFGAQNESVDSVGLNGFSANIKDAWHLYPGLSAIEAAKKNGKVQLAQWLTRKVEDEGQGIALLEKNGMEFLVFDDLPSIAELKRLTDPREPNFEWPLLQGASVQRMSAEVEVESDAWGEPEPMSEGDLLDILRRWRQQTGKNPSDEELLAAFCRFSGCPRGEIPDPQATILELRRKLRW